MPLPATSAQVTKNAQPRAHGAAAGGSTRNGRITSTLRALALASAGASLALTTGCASEPYPFNPRNLQEQERRASAGQVPPVMRPLPTTLQSPLLDEFTGQVKPPANPPTTGQPIEDFPTRRLTLQETVQRAVANNLAIKVAGYEPAIEGARVVEAEARFDPAFFFNTGVERNRRLITQDFFFNPTAGLITQETSEVFTVQPGLRQNLPSGGQIELRSTLTQTDLDRNDGLNRLNPYNEGDIAIQLTQPLLRDFGYAVNRAQIRIARNNQRISLLEFRNTAEDQILQLERLYWQLVAAEEDVRIQELLLADTEETARILLLRAGQDVTRVQISQANASVETRRVALIRARAEVRDVSDQIKQLMNDPEYPVASDLVILPASTPLLDPVSFIFEEQLESAMEHRLELAQQQQRVDSADITLDAARNNLLPQLNFVGSLGSQGLDDDWLSGLRSSLEFEQISWTAGIQFEVPIGNRSARAIYRRVLLQRSQSIEQYRQLIDQVTLDVQLGVRAVQTAWQETVAARQAVFAQEDSLRAIEQREAADEPLTPEFVQLKLDRQQALAEARRAEINAVANYNFAIASLERAKGTLLRYNNILLEEERLDPRRLR